MIKKFTKHINSVFPFLKNETLLIGVSAGIDSVVLVYLLHKLKYNIVLAHCNFKLRNNESNQDEEFVKKLGKKLNIKTLTNKFDTQKYAKDQNLSVQLAARKLRYNWFEKLTKKYKINYVLTAHHLNDNLETFLINISRGTGLKGLTGIPEINGKIVRPLLIFSKKEIHKYAVENKIDWREDSSNSSDKYLRNKIRHQAIPALEEITPTFLNSFQKTIEYLKDSWQIVEDYVADKKKEIELIENKATKLSISKIKKLKRPKLFLFYYFKNFGFTEINDIYNLLEAQSGKQVFSKSHRMLKDREFLVFLPLERTFGESDFFLIEQSTKKIDYPIALSIESCNYKETQKNEIVLDADMLAFPLIIRKKETGDVFYPTGMKGKKKVSKYFKDEKLSLIDKENSWLLCNAHNEVIWIINKRKDRRFIASKYSKNTIKISNT